MFHLVECGVDVEVKFGYDTQLMAFEMSHLATYGTMVLFYFAHHLAYSVGREDREVDVCYGKVGRDAYFTY